MEKSELKKIKSSISDLVDKFNAGLKEKELGHLSLSALHLCDGPVANPSVCYFDPQGRQICDSDYIDSQG